MLNHYVRAGAEATSGTERPRQRPDEHIDIRNINILLLRHPTARPPQDAKGPGLIEDQPKLIPALEFDLGWPSAGMSPKTDCFGEPHQSSEIDRIPNVLKEALGDDEPSGQWLSGLFLDHPL